MPSGPPPVDNDSGEQGWWTCTHTCIAQAPRLPCSSAAAAQTGTVSSQAGRDEERPEDRRLSLTVTKPLQHLVQPPSSLPLQMTLKSLQKKQTKNFEIVLTNLFCSFAYFLVSPSDIQKFTFCMNIFFTLIFFHEKVIWRLSNKISAFPINLITVCHILIGYCRPKS